MKFLQAILLVLLFCPLAALSADGEVLSEKKITDDGLEGFTVGSLSNGDGFGAAISNIGDLDGDGVTDLAVGAPFDDDGGVAGFNRGAVWILFMNSDGTVAGQQKISSTSGGFTGILDPDFEFGHSVAGLGDLDGDGVRDIVVGAPGDGVGIADSGTVWVLFLNTDGTVKSHVQIGHGSAGLSLTLGDRFGSSVASIGDVNDDGVKDIGVGAPLEDSGGLSRGAVYVLFMNTNGTASSHAKISDTDGGFTALLDNSDNLGTSIASVRLGNNANLKSIAVGAPGDDDGPSASKGAIYLMQLKKDGSVKSHVKISSTVGGLSTPLDHFDLFGSSIASLGDVNGDGNIDIAVGAIGDDDGCSNNCGAAFVVMLNSDGTVAADQKISNSSGMFTGPIGDGAEFGTAVAGLGDLDGDGHPDLAVGAPNEHGTGSFRGAFWNLFLDGTP